MSTYSPDELLRLTDKAVDAMSAALGKTLHGTPDALACTMVTVSALGVLLAAAVGTAEALASEDQAFEAAVRTYQLFNESYRASRRNLAQHGEQE